MNKQGRIVNGKVVGGIEWTKTRHPDGHETQGFTLNMVGGCDHKCRWKMPDGEIAICYAENTAENSSAKMHYPHGFNFHYWHPERAAEPERVKVPARIFLDSMSDLMGKRVTDDQIKEVLQVCRKCHWHTFQLLTKNPPRLTHFVYPSNVWVGASTPPDFMHGKELTRTMQTAMLRRTLSVLNNLKIDERAHTVWMSVEPLSWDVAPYFSEAEPLDWVVIGPATSGRKVHQPNPEHVQKLLDVLDRQRVPVFFKGQLDWSPWREEFPTP